MEQEGRPKSEGIFYIGYRVRSYLKKKIIMEMKTMSPTDVVAIMIQHSATYYSLSVAVIIYMNKPVLPDIQNLRNT